MVLWLCIKSKNVTKTCYQTLPCGDGERQHDWEEEADAERNLVGTTVAQMGKDSFI